MFILPVHFKSLVKIILLIALSGQCQWIAAQASSEPIYGPYEDYPGTYYVRVFIYFVYENTNWTQSQSQAQLQERAEGIFENLNAAFNKHGIYFIRANGLCSGAIPLEIQQIKTYHPPPHLLKPDALTIFDFGDSGSFDGHSFSSPNSFLRVKGSEGSISASHSPILINEVGNCLGLLPLSAGYAGASGCDESTGKCPPVVSSGTEICYCCGDGVCDTPPSPVHLYITQNCNVCKDFYGNSVPIEICRNYMSGAANNQSILCTDRFTVEQVQRMRAYLEKSVKISPLQVKRDTVSGSLPGGVYSQITVKKGTELIINQPIEMLPGGNIRVERGALLTVRSTITGSCGKMWRGIIVEGREDLSQVPANQGKVEVKGDGIIEHALCAIDVQDIDSPISTTSGGGIVEITGGTLENNSIGIRFGQHNTESTANKSKLLFAHFSTTDDYRGGDIKPVYIHLEGIVLLNVFGSSFRDLRSQCLFPSKRATGIVALNASLKVSNGCLFENLDIGLNAGYIVDGIGSYQVANATFKNCFTGIFSTETDKFIINGNNFLLKRSEFCPPLIYDFTGVRLKNKATGFTISRNKFYFDGTELPLERLVGIYCENTGNGLDNIISQNSFSNLTIGTRVSKNNGSSHGLLYLCNTNSFTLPDTVPVHIDFLIDQTGSIKTEQSGGTNQDGPLPAGNQFSGKGYTFKNESATIVQYYYYDAEPDQSPLFTNYFMGINPKAVGQPACVEPCENPPCPEPDPNDAKESFNDGKQNWLAKREALPFVTGEEQTTTASEGNKNHTWLIKITNDGCLDTLFCGQVDAWEVWPEKEGMEVKVYPNPASERIIIKAEKGLKAGEAVLYNLSGKTVFRQSLMAGTDLTELLVSGFPAGLYLLEIRDEGGRFERFKVIILH